MSSHFLRAVSCVVLTVLAPGALKGAGIVAQDGFAGPAQADLGGAGGGTGWVGAWTNVNSSQLTSVGGAGLTFPGLTVTPGAATTPAGGSFDAAGYSRQIAAYGTPGGVVYLSFLLRPDAGYGSYAGVEIGAYPRQIQIGTPLGYYQYGLRMGRYGFVLSTVPVVQGRTTFLVLEIDSTVTPPAYNLYVDPRPQDPKPPYPSCTQSAAGYPVHPTELLLTNDGGYTTDEIRVATTWEAAMGRSVCAADFNSDGTVNADDLSDYITCYFSLPACDRAEFNGDGTLNADDLADYITAYFGPTC